jgi:hypothetical protein
MDSKVSSNLKPCRAGLKWTPEENIRLMNRVIKGKNVEDIARKHHRTTNAIKLRILDNAMQMVQSGLTMEDVCQKLFLVHDDLKTHISRKTGEHLLKSDIEIPPKSSRKEVSCKTCDLLRQQLEEKDKHIAWLLTQVSQKQSSVRCQEVSLIDL